VCGWGRAAKRESALQNDLARERKALQSRGGDFASLQEQLRQAEQRSREVEEAHKAALCDAEKSVHVPV